MEQIGMFFCGMIGLFLVLLLSFLLWRSGRYRSRRQRWLFKKYNVDYDHPLYILPDGRMVLKKLIVSHNVYCIWVTNNWDICDYEEQEFDCIWVTNNWNICDYEEQEFDPNDSNNSNNYCVLASKNDIYGVFNTEKKRMVVDCKYLRDQIVFRDSGILIRGNAPYEEMMISYEGKVMW